MCCLGKEGEPMKEFPGVRNTDLAVGEEERQCGML